MDNVSALRRRAALLLLLCLLLALAGCGLEGEGSVPTGREHETGRFCCRCLRRKA